MDSIENLQGDTHSAIEDCRCSRCRDWNPAPVITGDWVKDSETGEWLAGLDHSMVGLEGWKVTLINRKGVRKNVTLVDLVRPGLYRHGLGYYAGYSFTDGW